MCQVVEENSADAIQGYLGDKSAGSRLGKQLRHLETIYEDVHKIFAAQNESFTAVTEAETKPNASAAEVLNSDSLQNGAMTDSERDVRTSKLDTKDMMTSNNTSTHVKRTKRNAQSEVTRQSAPSSGKTDDVEMSEADEDGAD